MKNALFSGISSAQKDSDSDDEKNKKQEEPPAAEINLLDFDGPSQAQETGDLLGGQQNSSDLLGGSQM